MPHVNLRPLDILTVGQPGLSDVYIVSRQSTWPLVWGSGRPLDISLPLHITYIHIRAARDNCASDTSVPLVQYNVGHFDGNWTNRSTGVP